MRILAVSLLVVTVGLAIEYPFAVFDSCYKDTVCVDSEYVTRAELQAGAGGGFPRDSVFMFGRYDPDSSGFLITKNARHYGWLLAWVPTTETSAVAAIPALPSGSGFFYDPRKGALVGGFNREGLCTADSVRPHSIRFGVDNWATDTAGALSGWHNKAEGMYAVVAGGRGNTASGYHALVAGGLDDTASGQYSCVVGGALNIASGLYSCVAGGYDNTASGQGAFTAGQSNVASGFGAVALGGNSTASGEWTTVLGEGITVSGNYSAASGDGDATTVTQDSVWAFVGQRVAVCSTGVPGSNRLFVKGNALVRDTLRAGAIGGASPIVVLDDFRRPEFDHDSFAVYSGRVLTFSAYVQHETTYMGNDPAFGYGLKLADSADIPKHLLLLRAYAAEEEITITPNAPGNDSAFWAVGVEAASTGGLNQNQKSIVDGQGAGIPIATTTGSYVPLYSDQAFDGWKALTTSTLVESGVGIYLNIIVKPTEPCNGGTVRWRGWVVLVCERATGTPD